MFLIRWTLALAVVPVFWAGLLLARFHYAGVSLLSIAYRMTGDWHYAHYALHHMRSHLGSAASRAQSEQWLRDKPCPTVAAYAGLTALGEGDIQAARDHLASADEMGADPSGNRDLLEMALADADPDPRALRDLARRMEPRTDLPSPVRRLVLGELLWDDLLCERFDQARQRAKHLLSIDDHPSAAVVMWALARQARRDTDANRWLQRTAQLEPAQRLYLQVVAAAGVGLDDEVAANLPHLAQADADLARQARQVWQLKGRGQWT